MGLQTCLRMGSSHPMEAALSGGPGHIDCDEDGACRPVPLCGMTCPTQAQNISMSPISFTDFKQLYETSWIHITEVLLLLRASSF